MLLAVVTTAVFALVRLAPGDTADVLAGQSGADPAYLALIRHRYELDRPLRYQVAVYLGHAARGDLGFSLVQGRPVREAILARLGASALLAGAAVALAALVGVALGALAGARGGTIDASVSVLSVLAYSVPVFWLGQLLIGLFAVRLHWLPAGGMRSADGPGGAEDVARHLVLPAGALSLLLTALVVRVTRTASAEALAEEYVKAARAKGCSELRVVVLHALPNALRPVVTVLTGYVGLVLTGSVLVETVFVWPGLGRLVYDAVLARDTPVLAGLVLVGTTVVVLANIVADLLYRALDPRTRLP